MERADEVLALGQVDRGLAADGGVDLREQRGRRLHDVDPAVVHGRREAGGVADHAAPEGDDGVVTQQAPRGQARAQVVDGGEGLGFLALADEEQVGVAPARWSAAVSPGAWKSATPGWLTTATRASSGEQAPGLAERAVADQHVVGRARERDGHPFHAWSSSITAAATSSTVRPSVSTFTCAPPRTRARAARRDVRASRSLSPPTSSGRVTRRPRGVTPSSVVDARNHTTSPWARSARRLSASSTAPPPHEITSGVGDAAASATASRSARGSRASPRSTRSRRHGTPAAATDELVGVDEGRGRAARRSAPPPWSCPRPSIRRARDAAQLIELPQRREVRGVVAHELLERVAAELAGRLLPRAPARPWSRRPRPTPAPR